MEESKNSCWKFWKLPVEPLGFESEKVYGIAVLEIKAFRAKFKVDKESERWILEKISKNDFVYIRKIIESKVNIIKVLIDIAKTMIIILLAITFLSSIYFFILKEYILGLIFVFASIVSIIFIKILGVLFIRLLKVIEFTLTQKFDDLNQWLFSSDRKIIIGPKCFWIKIEAGIEDNVFNTYQINSIQEWLHRRRSSVNT